MTATLDWPRPVAVLNIGGVANVTSVDQNDDWVAFDTGPGSALLDDFMHAGTGEPWDEDGAAANLERPAMTVGNGAATLTMLTVETIGIARPFAPTAAQLDVAGGGARNQTLMAMLTACSRPGGPGQCAGQGTEAQAFAYLAMRSLQGAPTFPGTTGV